jgi:hypothetical protein
MMRMTDTTMSNSIREYPVWRFTQLLLLADPRPTLPAATVIRKCPWVGQLPLPTRRAALPSGRCRFDIRLGPAWQSQLTDLVSAAYAHPKRLKRQAGVSQLVVT